MKIINIGILAHVDAGKNPDIDNVHVYPPYKARMGAKIPSG